MPLLSLISTLGRSYEEQPESALLFAPVNPRAVAKAARSALGREILLFARFPKTTVLAVIAMSDLTAPSV